MDVYKTACWFGNQYFLGRYRKNREEVNLSWFINDIRGGVERSRNVSSQ